ncbi:MAG: hypothetical protein EXR75_13440 [Myxococcales bacterium]|nr:hypothetical protein [Myxococcales bacterium]
MWIRLPRIAISSIFSCLMLALGCGARDDGRSAEDYAVTSTSGGEGGEGGGGGAAPVGPPKAERVDVLLVVDNSRSMGVAQQWLAATAQSLFGALASPPCVNTVGNFVTVTPSGSCPPESTRLFAPRADVHIAVITTSLGSHGADSCLEPREDDHGRLVSYAPGGGTVPTYQALGFLAWDPKGKLSPPGEVSSAVMTGSLVNMILGAGDIGCGFESTLESWYRFLVDPNPYESIAVTGTDATLVGTDALLLEQRAAFLRPDSLVLIVTLSDENDCSVRDGNSYFLALQRYTPNTTNPYHLPKARAACATDPESPCCRSCGQTPDQNCDSSQDDCAGTVSAQDDPIGLRCWDQKRRFGLDFLNPILRYVDGLSRHTIVDRDGDVVPNPLFHGVSATDGASVVRDTSMVLYAGIVGVPWQDIARRDGTGKPDVNGGLDALGRKVGGFQSAKELTNNGTWALILGDPSAYHTEPNARPTDPLMQESIAPRTGTHPITGEALAPPGSPVSANSINGHEHAISNKDSLQYACVAPLDIPKDCANFMSCACPNLNSDDPLCQDDSGIFGSVQLRMAGLPGIRHLELAKGLDDRAVVGSVCPVPGQAYNPILRPLLDTLAPRLK